MSDSESPGRLYVVATPIGNLGDLSARAREVFESVDIVAAEDTRVTGRLLSGLGVDARLVSYRDANEEASAAGLVARLEAGASVALASDAGTPCISDPGYRLVRAAADAGIEVVSVPGASALTAFLSISGLPTDRFAFEGFLPTAAGQRRRRLAAMAAFGGTVVLYESPRRLVKLLREIAYALGDPPVAIGRELTKRHEEVVRGSASEVASAFEQRDGIRGECAVGIDLRAVESGEAAVSDAEIEAMLGAGNSARDVAAELKPRGVSRSRVYELAKRRDD